MSTPPFDVEGPRKLACEDTLTDHEQLLAMALHDALNAVVALRTQLDLAVAELNTTKEQLTKATARLQAADKLAAEYLALDATGDDHRLADAVDAYLALRSSNKSGDLDSQIRPAGTADPEGSQKEKD